MDATSMRSGPVPRRAGRSPLGAARRSAAALMCLALVAAGAGCTGQSAASPDSSDGIASQTPIRTSGTPGDATAASAIRAIAADPDGLTRDALSSAERAQLTDLYAAVEFTPLWVDPMGRPHDAARDALARIRAADVDGLAPQDYDAAGLATQAAALDAAEPPAASDIARFDAGLSANTLRYLRHLHRGRVDPRTIGFRLQVPPDDLDYAATLRAALQQARFSDAADALAPPLVLYRGLRRMLAQYRSPAILDLPAPSFPATTVRPGDPYAGAAALHRFLAALGDLPAGSPSPETARYDGALVDGVAHFQMRHGLATDGVIGRETRAALQVPLATRVRQIELALERLRWLPRLDPDRFLAVNIPMFRLWVWDTIPPNGAPTLGLGVIVGRALDTQTPVFVHEMRHVIFRPYWNVPSSIVRDELLPAVRKDPNYFQQHEFEIVSGPGDSAPVVALTPESLDQLARGEYRVRQRPGPNNALGLVKFVFPNDERVYMHGTPATELFSHSRRDFSHGCVRVEDPVTLAEWALRSEPGWTRERILEAMHGPRPLQVNLTRPIQVILFYVTAVVMPEDGTIRFAEDIYGHDARLDRALDRLR